MFSSKVREIAKRANKLAQNYSYSIPQVKLGNTGVVTGRLGLGTWEVGHVKLGSDELESIIKTLMENGGNLIDTAPCYEDSEIRIGKAIKNINRDDLILETKAGHVPDNDYGSKNDSDDFKPSVIRDNVERSLKRLNVDYLDILLLHSNDLESLHKGDSIDELIRLQDEGKTRFIGYSGDNEGICYASNIPEFSVIETSVNIADQRNQKEFLKEIKSKGYGVVAKRPVANACWRSKDDIYQKAYEYGSDYRERLRKMGYDVDDAEYSSHDEWIESALYYSTASLADVLIVGTTRSSHMRQNISIVSEGQHAELGVESFVEAFTEAQNKSDKYSKDRKWLGLV